MSTTDVSSAARPTCRTALPIFLAMLAPIVIALVYANLAISEARSQSVSGQRIADMIAQATEANALAHELQKERGMSAGFVGSKGAQFGPQLKEQRRVTDEVLARVREQVLQIDQGLEGEAAERVRQRSGALERFFGLLGELRGTVDRRMIAVAELTEAYTGSIRLLLGVADDPMASGLVGDMARRNLVFGDVLMAKEFAGVERAMGAVGFGSGKFEEDILFRYGDLQSRQVYLLERAANFAPPAHREAIAEAMRSAAARRVTELRNLAAASVETGDLGGVDGPEWFEASTAWLGELDKVNDQISGDLRRRAQASADLSAYSVWSHVGVGLAAIGLAIVVGRIIWAA